MSNDRDRQRLHRAREREVKAILPVEVESVRPGRCAGRGRVYSGIGLRQSRQDPGRPQRAKDDAEAAAEISRHATDADPRAAAYDAMCGACRRCGGRRTHCHDSVAPPAPRQKMFELESQHRLPTGLFPD